MLPEEATHYAIPTSDVVGPFLEIFEQPAISGVILLQTVVSSVKESKKGTVYQRLKALTNERRRGNIFFSNELCKQTFVDPASNAGWTWGKRLIWEASCWYARHIDQVQIILIVDAEREWHCDDTPTNSQDTPTNLRLMTLGQYLEEFHSELMEQYLSLRASLEVEIDGLIFSKQTPNSACCGSHVVVVVVVDGDFPPHVTRDKMLQGITMGRLVSGTLHVNKKKTSLAYVKPGSSWTEGDILIEGVIDRNRGIHGDFVAVEILGKSEKKGDFRKGSQQSEIILWVGPFYYRVSSHYEGNVICGRIVGILERRTLEHVAVFPDMESSSSSKAKMVLVVPYDVRIPKIRASTHLGDELRNCRILVRVDGWEEGSRYPHGHFVCSLGPIGDVETETKAILTTHGLVSQPFTKAHLAELPPQDWKLTEEEVSKRRDLRSSHLVFSIDPKGCEDIDDAMSVRVKKNGHLELGVHIADVSYFVSSGSLLDQEAASRATTVYLVDRRYDMLPGRLSTDLCSLWSGVDRCAVAQAIVDGGSLSTDAIRELKDVDISTREESVRELKKALQHLTIITRELKRRRKERGALELDGTEMKMSVTTSQNRVFVEEVTSDQTLSVEAHSTVAECMILTNHWVAKRIYEAFPSTALLRAHASPDTQDFSQLQRLVSIRGHHIDTSSNKTVADSLERCASGDSVLGKVMRMMTVRAMRNAVYFSTGTREEDQFYHYGLGLDFYTHFTSPIRRYADIVVHRLLLTAVGESPQISPAGEATVDAVCSHITKQNLSSKAAQTESSDFFKALLLKDKKNQVQGVVTEIRDNGVSVCVLRYGLQGMVYLRDKEGRVLKPSNAGKDVIFGEGTLEPSDTSVTISFSGGQYSIQLLDHLLLTLSVEESRAHGLSFAFELASCRVLQVSEITEKRGDVLKTQSNVGGMAAQEEVTKTHHKDRPTLYELISKLHKLSLEE
jgi:DIS3-like exonuclease 1